jgi:hypothetical protein
MNLKRELEILEARSGINPRDPLLILTHGNLTRFEGGNGFFLDRTGDETEKDFIHRANRWARECGFLVLTGRPRQEMPV